LIHNENRLFYQKDRSFVALEEPDSARKEQNRQKHNIQIQTQYNDLTCKTAPTVTWRSDLHFPWSENSRIAENGNLQI